MTGPQTGRMGSSGATVSMGRRFVSSVEHPDRQWIVGIFLSSGCCDGGGGFVDVILQDR